MTPTTSQPQQTPATSRFADLETCAEAPHAPGITQTTTGQPNGNHGRKSHRPPLPQRTPEAASAPTELKRAPGWEVRTQPTTWEQGRPVHGGVEQQLFNIWCVLHKRCRLQTKRSTTVQPTSRVQRRHLAHMGQCSYSIPSFAVQAQKVCTKAVSLLSCELCCSAVLLSNRW